MEHTRRVTGAPCVLQVTDRSRACRRRRSQGGGSGVAKEAEPELRDPHGAGIEGDSQRMGHVEQHAPMQPTRMA